VEIDGNPFALKSANYNATTAVFSYEIHVTAPGTFVLERSSDFSNWTGVATNTITEGFLVRFDVTTQPRFFRLRRQ
jgi:hypothetical protein